jgi:hypothetical protein
MTYSDSPDLLEYIRDAVSRFPGRLIAYARLDPGDPASREHLARAVTSWGFRGLKLHPVGNHIHPAQTDSLDLIRSAASLGVPVLFHCGDEEFTLPFQVAAAAREVPLASIILGHMGGYFHVQDAILAGERFPNLYLETSAMPYPGMVREAVNRLGADRVLFASDGPGCPPGLELSKIRLAGLDREDEEKVLSGNIKRLIGL